MSNETVGNDRMARVLERYIIRRPFTTAAGLAADQKIDLDLPNEKSPFFIHIVEAIGTWAVARKVSVLTGVPQGATRYAKAASRQFELPFVEYRKRQGVYSPYYGLRGGLEILHSDDKSVLVGIVEDVRSTGLSMANVAKTINHRKTGLAIVDRGEDIQGVSTIEQAKEYSDAHPTLPPPHISLSFACESLFSYPLALKAA